MKLFLKENKKNGLERSVNLILIIKTNLFYSIVWVHLIFSNYKTYIFLRHLVQTWFVIYDSWSDSEKVLKKCAENFEQIHFDLWLMVRQSLFGANFLFWHEKAFCVFFLQEWTHLKLIWIIFFVNTLWECICFLLKTRNLQFYVSCNKYPTKTKGSNQNKGISYSAFIIMGSSGRGKSL